MADIQSMDKPSWTMTCKDLLAHSIAFIHRNMMNMMNYIILFDRCDIPKSLKLATRHFGLGDSYPVAYHSTDTTNFKWSTEETVIPHSNEG